MTQNSYWRLNQEQTNDFTRFFIRKCEGTESSEPQLVCEVDNMTAEFNAPRIWNTNDGTKISAIANAYLQASDLVKSRMTELAREQARKEAAKEQAR